MTKNILSFLFVLVAHLGFSQVTLTITDPDYSQTNPLNCAGIVPTGGQISLMVLGIIYQIPIKP